MFCMSYHTQPGTEIYNQRQKLYAVEGIKLYYGPSRYHIF